MLRSRTRIARPLTVHDSSHARHLDNLAHTLAGAVLAESGLKRRTPLATTTLLVGANLPDIDVAVMLFNSGLAARRGWTHGVLAIAVLPFLLTAAVIVWDRAVRRRRRPERPPVIRSQLLLLSFLAVLSHPFLDWLNSYGLRWLMPFDGRWFYGDALFIVDPWLWLALLMGVLLARRRGTTRPALVAIGAASVYIVLMLGSAALGRSLVRSGVAIEGLSVERVMVGPVLLNPNRRDVIFESEGRYFRGSLHWFPGPRLVIAEGVIAPDLEHPLVRVASADEDARRFRRWSRFPYATVEEGPTGGALVTFDDLRYTDGSTRSWAAVEVEVVPPGREPGTPRWGPPVIETSAALVP